MSFEKLRSQQKNEEAHRIILGFTTHGRWVVLSYRGNPTGMSTKEHWETGDYVEVIEISGKATERWNDNQTNGVCNE